MNFISSLRLLNMPATKYVSDNSGWRAMIKGLKTSNCSWYSYTIDICWCSWNSMTAYKRFFQEKAEVDLCMRGTRDVMPHQYPLMQRHPFYPTKERKSEVTFGKPARWVLASKYKESIWGLSVNDSLWISWLGWFLSCSRQLPSLIWFAMSCSWYWNLVLSEKASTIDGTWELKASSIIWAKFDPPKLSCVEIGE